MADGMQWYQEMIRYLRWETEIGNIHILLEVAVMSKNIALPKYGKLEQVLNIMGYLNNHNKRRLMFDSINNFLKESLSKEYYWFDFYRDAEEAKPPNMPKARVNVVTMSCFVDVNHSGNKVERRIQTGILIFINRAPINWYSNQQPHVEASKFGAKFCAIKVGVEIIEGL